MQIRRIDLALCGTILGVALRCGRFWVFAVALLCSSDRWLLRWYAWMLGCGAGEYQGCHYDAVLLATVWQVWDLGTFAFDLDSPFGENEL